ncbi:MAG TPA: type II secretion system protein GspC [Nevskiaceae bacterium]|nr:type II secretion system protein GspC [Nevskiaceae bacterium]
MPTASLQLPPALLRSYERYGRHLPRVAEVVLVVLVAQAAAALMWKLIPVPATAAWTPPTPMVDPTQGGGNRGPNVDAIMSAHLFGQYVPPSDPALDAMSEAPDTHLNLTLMGILAATADRGSRALIAASNGEENPFAIGDDVVRGVTLQAIFPDRVILSRNGQLETLRLDKNTTGGKLPAGFQNYHRPAVDEGGDEEEEGGDDTSAMLSDIREELMTDPSRASEYIRVQPASNGGQLRGYRIYPGRDRTVFSAIGLRPGDLVTQVNGIQLNDANTALAMLQQLSQANNLTVVIERGGQQQTVNVNLN